MKKKNKILKILLPLIFIILIVLLVVIFIMNNFHFTSNVDDPNAVTNDFELNGFHELELSGSYKSYNVPPTFEASSKKSNGEYVNLSFKVKDVHLPEHLFDYKDDIRLRISYSPDTQEIYNCDVINRFSGETIKNLSKNNLKKLFDVSYNKKVIKKDFSTEIKLSELDENELYEFEISNNSDDKYQCIEIINDIGKNCIIYSKNANAQTFDRKFNLSKKITAKGYTKSFDFMYNTSFNILYKAVDDDELSKIISQEDIIYLSNYSTGDTLDISSSSPYIYNDTQKNAFIIDNKVEFKGFEGSSSNMLKEGEICEFNGSSDTTYVAFENTNNTDNIMKKSESN